MALLYQQYKALHTSHSEFGSIACFKRQHHVALAVEHILNYVMMSVYSVETTLKTRALFCDQGNRTEGPTTSHELVGKCYAWK